MFAPGRSDQAPWAPKGRFTTPEPGTRALPSGHLETMTFRTFRTPEGE